MPSYTQGLNESQKQAVLHTNGPLLVLAGAGSGKTRVLTNRIARLVHEKKCKSSQILAVTFTNKAAMEMQQRMARLVSAKAAKTMTIATFHSLGARILREDGQHVGVHKNFTILDDHQRLAIVKEILRSSGGKSLQEKHEEIGVAISLAKNSSLEENNPSQDEAVTQRFPKIYKAYRAVSLKRQTIDFDDLLLLPLRLFERRPDILEKYREQYSFFSIDEFQDTNTVQLKLALLLSAPKNNIMAVGDDDQGIYSWRGADINNILSFPVHFPGCTKIVLDTNYRSTRNILEGAMAVVSHNRKRTLKHITAAAGDGEAITLFKADDEEEEVDWIAGVIRDHVQKNQFAFRDHALFMRTNAMMARFEEGLRRNKIPYCVFGATSFFDRKEVKDIIAYLRFFANTADELSLLRVLKVPDRGIAPSTLEKLDECASHRRIGLWDAICRHMDIDAAPLQHEHLSAFISFYHKHAVEFARGHLSLTLKNILTECDYLQLLRRASKDDNTAEFRLANVDEIVRGLEQYETRTRGKPASLVEYLRELALIKNDEAEDDESKERGVRVMTLHKAKGLEFPVSFLCNLDDSIMPSPKAILEGGIEEERRLFYVGMTRAQKKLILTYPAIKEFRKKNIQVTPTRFIREIPPEFLDDDAVKKNDERKEEFVDDFFEGMRKQFVEKGLTGAPEEQKNIQPQQQPQPLPKTKLPSPINAFKIPVDMPPV
jgi:DNA helicase II / ATP-dependent DNA helicase PcrA